MSNCIKDLYDCKLIKKCSKCAIVSLKSNFQKIKTKSDCLQTYCVSCVKQKQKQ